MDLFAIALCFLSAAPVAMEGHIQLQRGFPKAQIMLVGDDERTTLQGPLSEELRQLQSAKVRVRGAAQNNAFEVAGYDILDIGRGVRPLVGTLVRIQDRLAFREKPEAKPLLASVGPRMRSHLERHLGAKVWIVAKVLVSGELQIRRLGVLRKALPSAQQAPSEENP